MPRFVCLTFAARKLETSNVRYDDPARPQREGVRLQTSGAPLPVITLVAAGQGGNGRGWLACIHPARGSNKFGYHSAVLEDLGEFSQEFLADPEAALAKYFRYEGPEEPAAPERPNKAILPDLWEEGP